MNFNWTSEQRQFRSEVRSFIEDHLPADWEVLTEGLDVGSDYTVEFARKFCPALAKAGLLVPHWPAEHGGRDADAWHHWILNEEMLVQGEPRSFQYMSVNWAGPAIIKFGADEQKSHFLPRIAGGELFFCQGFSEPNAGSDLASLRTKAERVDGGWKINGQKIWTSAASFADYCVLLARTGEEGRKGISVFLTPMDAQGIEVRIIKGMMGARAFHEVFFNDVFVPDAALLGDENEGWNIVRTILHNERIGIPRYVLTLRALDRAVNWLRNEGLYSEHAALRAAHARALCEAARLQCYSVIDARVKGRPPSSDTYVTRYNLVLADKAVAEFFADYLWERLISNEDRVLAGAYRRMAATGIASGAAEIQLDLIARHRLELPRSR